MSLLGTYFFAILFLPGTFVHEISHFLTALVLLVPVGQIELMPEKFEGGVKLGSVPIGKTDPIRRTLIGIAPIIFGLGLIFGILYYVYKHNLYTMPIIVVLVALMSFEVGNTMFSSKKDLEGAMIAFILVAIIFAVSYFLGLRIYINLDSPIIKAADLFLLVPIGIDILFSL